MPNAADHAPLLALPNEMSLDNAMQNGKALQQSEKWKYRTDRKWRGVQPSEAHYETFLSYQGDNAGQGVRVKGLEPIPEGEMIGELRGKDRYFTMEEYRRLPKWAHGFFVFVTETQQDVDGAIVPEFLPLEWPDKVRRVWILDAHPDHEESNVLSYVNHNNKSETANLHMKWCSGNFEGRGHATYVALICNRIIYPGMELILLYGGESTNDMQPPESPPESMPQEKKRARDHYMKEDGKSIHHDGHMTQDVPAMVN